MRHEKEKKFAASLSIISNTSLIALKFIAGIISGSISIISEAIHSFSDLLASIVAFFSVSKSCQPADKDHPFGHGKYEDLSGLIEGGLILLAAIYISYEAIKKIISPQSIDIQVDIGLWVMGFSIIANIIVSAYLFHVAKISDSMAIFADAEHLRTDVYSSLGVCIGLLFVKLTGNHIFDPITALIVAVIIFIAGSKIVEKSADNLLDKSLNEEDSNKIQEIIESFLDDKIIAIKDIRTRKSGMKKNINITLIANKLMPIIIGHELCDQIEHEIDKSLGNTDITIHLEPN